MSGHYSVQAQVDKLQHEAELVKIKEMNSDDMKTSTAKWDQALTSLKDQLQKASNETEHFKGELGNVKADRANLVAKLKQAEAKIASLEEKLK